MTEPLDTGDVDALDELLDSPGWKLVRARLETQLRRSLDDLERDLDVPGTAKARGSVAAVRMMLALPKAMRDEISGGLKKANK